jgi:FkbM family methyltransferase
LNRGLARLGKRLAARAGLRITRGDHPPNRFDAMDEVLGSLRAGGFRPRVVIDCGANQGTWTRLSAQHFPEARLHLVEAQPRCAPILARDFPPPRFQVHSVAVTAPGVASVRMFVADAGTTTGASVVRADAEAPSGEHVTEVPASTLDALFGAAVSVADRALLKLDLEGHEIPALRGATALLPRVEVVVCEVAFYDIAGEGRPGFVDVLDFVRAAGFRLYDFAALGARRRDNRLRSGDAVFVRSDSAILDDVAWS